MKLLCSLLVAHGALSSNAFEFGRLDGGRNSPSMRNLEKDAFVDEESQVFMELERFLEVSMSLSMSYSTGTNGQGGSGGGSGGNSGTGGGGNPSFTPSPTVAPTVTPSPNLDGSAAASSSAAPSEASSAVTSDLPTLSPAPTPVAAGLFECTDQGVAMAGSPALVTTPVSLQVLYEAESTVDTTDGFLSDLEQALFSIALTAALECDGNGRRQLESDVVRKLSTSSSVVGSCNATEGVDNTCFTLETVMEFILNENVDPEYAAFLSYTALQAAMDNYTGDGIDTVVRLDYLAPTPTMPSPAPAASQADSRGNVNPFVIGAAAAMVAGGALALYVWMNNRRLRNKRHVELQEDNSLSPVSFFSAERDPYEDA